MHKRIVVYLLTVLLAFVPCMELSSHISFAKDYDIRGSDQRDLDAGGVHYFDIGGSDCILPVDPGEYPYKNKRNSNDFIDFWHDTAVFIETAYGIPWEAVIAQAAIESGWGTDALPKTKNAYFGVNAVNSNPNKATAYSRDVESWYGKTKADGGESYAEFIRDNSNQWSWGAFEHVDNPEDFLHSLQLGSNGDKPMGKAYAQPDKNRPQDFNPEYAQNTLKDVKKRAAEQGWPSSKEIADSNPIARIIAADNAKGENVGMKFDEYLAKYNISTSCGGNGDILKTAEEMATWTEGCYTWSGGHGSTTDLDKRISNKFYDASYGVDCSGFVRAVVYHATGKDPGQFTTETIGGLKVFKKISESEVQPGDIWVTHHGDGHTGIVKDLSTGVHIHSTNGGCGSGHGPQETTNNWQMKNATWYRYIGEK